MIVNPIQRLGHKHPCRVRGGILLLTLLALGVLGFSAARLITGPRFPYAWLSRKWAIGASACSGATALIGILFLNWMRGPYKLLLTKEFKAASVTADRMEEASVGEYFIATNETDKAALFVACEVKLPNGKKEKELGTFSVSKKVFKNGEGKELNQQIIKGLLSCRGELFGWFFNS